MTKEEETVEVLVLNSAAIITIILFGLFAYSVNEKQQ